MLSKNINSPSSKEWKDHLGNFTQKICIVLVCLLALLFVIWLGKENYQSRNFIGFINWLAETWLESLPFPSLDVPQICVYVLQLSLFFIVIILYRILHSISDVVRNLANRINRFQKKTGKLRKASRWFIRTNETMRRVFIGLSFLSWLGYAFWKMIIIDEVWARACLWLSLVLTILLFFLEIFCVFGWDYLRFGHRGFYKGGKHWFEDEDKYLKDGDYGFFGKILYLFCQVVDKIPHFIYVRIISKIKIFHFIFIRIISLFKNAKFKSPGEHLYQLYILLRYNSLLYRIGYVVLLVFVALNLWHLLRGEIPLWSSWWNSKSAIGDFIESSTALKTFLDCPLNNLSILLLFGLIIEKGSRKAILKSFLYERLNMIIVVSSTIVAILLVLANVAQKNLMTGLLFADAFFTVVFLVEIAFKIYEAGRKYFLKETVTKGRFFHRYDWWNIVDTAVVLASITSIFMLKDEYQLISGMYAMIILRVVRLLKLLRLLKIFKKYLVNLFEGVQHALIKSIPIIIIFAVCLTFLGFVLYLLSAQWGIGRVYFENPITSVFSLFQLFTYDGWHQIPTKISEECMAIWGDVWWIDTAVRIGFCALVFAGGIVGVALLNSVFVDGMLLRDKSDEDRTRRLNELDRKMEEISTKLDDMEKRRLQT